MNGANTEPWVNTISAPIRRIVIIKGANQYFLRIFRKSQISIMSSKKFSMSEDSSKISILCFFFFFIGIFTFTFFS